MNYHFTIDEAIKNLKKNIKNGDFYQATILCNAILKFDPNNKYAKKYNKTLKSSKSSSFLIPDKIKIDSIEAKFNNSLFDEVILECEKLIKEGYSSSSVYNLYGSAFKEKGKSDEALKAYDIAISINQNNFAPFLNKSIIYFDLKLFDEAEQNILKSLSINSKDALANYMLAIILQESVVDKSQKLHSDLLKKAVSYFEKSFELNKSFIPLYSNYGNALVSLGELKKAKSIILQGLDLHPQNPILLYNMGNVYEKEQNISEAISYYNNALKYDKNLFQAHNNLGTLLTTHVKNFDLALKHYNISIALNPTDGDTLSNKGSLLEEMGQIDLAYETINKSIDMNSKNPKAHYNKAKILEKMGNIHEALTSYDRSIKLDSNYIDAKWNKSIGCFLVGDFTKGWEYYETRRKRSHWVKRTFNGKELTNLNELKDKSILLYSEQGLGDTIQFSRFALKLRDIASEVVLEVQKPLKYILSDITNIRTVETDEDIIKCDFHLPLMSLPKLLNTTIDTIPLSVPLKLSNKHSETWKNKIDRKKFNIGVAWLGSKAHEDDLQILKYRRSFSIKYFKHFENIPNVNFYSLQKYNDISEDIKKDCPIDIKFFDNFDNCQNAFEDTTALMQNLDLIISCDTSIAHIAGSMNCPVWVPLKFIPDWRWMLDKDYTPFYPSMKLFRQKEWGDWDFVFQNMRRNLLTLKGK